MADYKIKDLTGTATTPATDDYTIIDGVSSGTRKINLKSQLDLKVNNTGDETIEGVKTFSSAPVMSTQSMTDYTDKRFVTDAQRLILGDSVIRIGTCPTASATAAKVVALGITALTDGLTFLVAMTNANTSSTITFNVDSLGARNVYDKRGTQITGTYFSNTANEKVLLRYNSTLNGFELITADFWNARMGMPSSSYINLTLGASGSTYTAPADGELVASIHMVVGGFFAIFNGAIVNNNVSDLIDISVSPVAQNYIVKTRIKKGDSINYTYCSVDAINSFRFYYAEGSKP